MYKILRLWHTVKYLKPIQIYFRLFYYIRAKIAKGRGVKSSDARMVPFALLRLKKSIFADTSYSHGQFNFLHKTFLFEASIDWDFNMYGKLWTYNLTYFDYLNQENLSQEEGLTLIYDFIEHLDSIHDGLEPFPTSLRMLNWIKFLTYHQIRDRKVSDALATQYLHLMKHLEYHLLGNHLLENGFSLLFGAYYFQDERLYRIAKKILVTELEEQILEDGAHFELSPMYHQLMLFRLLDSINLLQNNHWKQEELLSLFIAKARLMLGWLNTITFHSGAIPLLNDSSQNIAPTTEELNHYASSLSIQPQIRALGVSGYRKVIQKRYEMIMDVGDIGSTYIPGHAHSDTFNFELYIDSHPVIVDTGVSTYENNQRRQVERSTQAHNTVVVDDTNQSEVWGGFRVAQRAKVIALSHADNSLKATHDGYRSKGLLHTREFITKPERIVIYDTLTGKASYPAVAYLHFHPSIMVEIKNNQLHTEEIIVNTSGSMRLDHYMYAPAFNIELKAQCAIILFQGKLEVEIRLRGERSYENN